MRRLAAAAVTALLSAAALTAGGGAAQAAAGVSVHKLGSLHLKRVDARNHKTSTAYLVCTSVSRHGAAPVIHGVGSIKDPSSACQELAEVHGRPDALAVHPLWLAPSIVAPVTVRIDGTWQGRKVAWSHTYTNGSWLAKATGDVFAF